MLELRIMKRRVQNFFLIFCFLAFLAALFPFFVSADFVGQTTNFFVDQSYDAFNRKEVTAILVKEGVWAYYYVEKDWWEKLPSEERQNTLSILNDLSTEFDQKIYPTLTATFGSEWRPGIDGDNKITILFHSMKDEAGGYFNSGNEFPKRQNPESNEREMTHLNIKRIYHPLLKSYLAHELIHLITFNQKEKLRGVTEEVWLNELRAEMAPTILGYDIVFENSNLSQRIRNFIDKPFNSLTEWEGKSFDYGIVNLFGQYLLDYYGVEVLVDSLKSSKVGIPSLEEALRKRNKDLTFEKVFFDWVIAVFVNDCSLGEFYCYRNPNLKNFRVAPQLNFLPSLGESLLTLTNATKDWAGGWYKIVGGKDILKVEFHGKTKTKFKVAYVTQNAQNQYQLKFLDLNSDQKGVFYVESFNLNIRSVTILVGALGKKENLENPQPEHLFSFVISTVEKIPLSEEEIRKQLLEKIESLKKEIALLQQKIKFAWVKKLGSGCASFKNDLFLGSQGVEVKCLQVILKFEDFQVGPSLLIDGNFNEATLKAVIKFQEKYKKEILLPAGLQKGTGFVGSFTRKKLNEILNSLVSS
jgi:hypothetical protein